MQVLPAADGTGSAGGEDVGVSEAAEDSPDLRGTFFLLLVYLMGIIALWATVYGQMIARG